MKLNHLRFNKIFFRDLWHLLKPYWTSEEKWSAWGLLLINILCVVGEVRANVGFNYFHKIFYNALQNFDKPAIFAALEYLFFVCIFLAATGAASIYVNGLLALRWRRWLTQNYLHKWLHNHNHYRMQLLNKNIDNPDQRISEDLDRFPTLTLDLFFGPYKFLHSLLMIFSFSYILWILSRSFTFNVGAWHNFSIPGYLCWLALIYAVIGTWIMGWIGKKLAAFNYQQQHFNADFRYGLVRFREASEQVSFYRGEAAERDKFYHLFSRIFHNFKNIIAVKTRLNFFNKGYGFMSYVVGLLVSMPYYLSKTFQLGTVMQISSAYNSVVSGFSTFMDCFDELAEWRSVIYRLTEFNHALHFADQETKIAIKHHEHKKIIVENLKLSLPNGKTLLDNINLQISAGQTLLMTGSSGIGKTTLLRALAGIWNHGEGAIHLPQEARFLFLPQKPYLPLGSLTDLLTYPNTHAIPDEKLQEALKLSFLEKFSADLTEIHHWAHELSLGEQQLIAFARIFLHRPEIVFLDEATSALDEQHEAWIYENLRKHLPETIVVSVGHRQSLHAFHEMVFAP